MLEKAKGPATAVGAALIGAAGLAATRNGGKGRFGRSGGAAVTSMLKPRSGLAKALSSAPKPDLRKALKGVDLPKLDGSMIDWVEQKARGVGDAGYRVAEMTGQARSVKDAISGENSK